MRSLLPVLLLASIACDNTDDPGDDNDIPLPAGEESGIAPGDTGDTGLNDEFPPRDTGVVEDTGTHFAGDLCAYTLRFDPSNLPAGMSFDLQEATSQSSVVSASAGFLSQPYIPHTFPLWLYDGSYELHLQVASNNWGGGIYTLSDANGFELYSGGVDGSSDIHEWELDCTPDTGAPVVPACSDVELTVSTYDMLGHFADEIRWELIDEAGNVVDSTEYEDYARNHTYTHTWSLADGTYTFRMWDSFGNDWDGATYEIHDGRELLLSEGTKALSGPEFAIEHSEDTLFVVDCTSIHVPAPITVDCSELDLQIIASTSADDIGFTMFAEFVGQVIDVDPGEVPAGPRLLQHVPMGDVTPWSRTDWLNGDYTVHLMDAPANGSSPDGWSASGDRVQLYNIRSGEVYREWGAGFDGGFSTTEFSLNCTNLVGGNGAGCAEDTIADCADACWPTAYLGDDFCDDGDLFAPDFNCEDHGYDDGDCLLP